MKVLELCLSDGVGGLELYAVRTAKQLLARDVDCIAVGRKETLFSRRMEDQGVKTYSLNTISPTLPLLAAKKLSKIIEKESIDLIHMHWGKDLNLAVLAKKMANRAVKLIYTRQMAITRGKHDFYHKFLYNSVDLYLTITNELAQMAKQWLPMSADRIERLYYGVDQPAMLDDDKRRQVRKELGVSSDDKFAIGLVGRIEEGKGQHILIDAVHQLKSENLPVHATIIGPVMNQEFFQDIREQVKKLGLEDEISFYGSHSNPIELMGAFDAVVLATKKETFGLVLIEAMRSGVAVVGTNAGGVPEIFDHGVSGLLVNPLDSQDLAEKLRILGENTETRREIAQNGLRRANQLFATEVHYEKLLSYFEKLVTH